MPEFVGSVQGILARGIFRIPCLMGKKIKHTGGQVNAIYMDIQTDSELL